MRNLTYKFTLKSDSNGSWTGLGRLLEACHVHEKVALDHNSKSKKYELEGSYNDPVHEHFSFLITAKLQRECNEEAQRPFEIK